MARSKSNMFNKFKLSEETKRKIDRKARREADIEFGITPYKTKVHKNKKAYSRKPKHKVLWEVE
jgi:hypothetical protein